MEWKSVYGIARAYKLSGQRMTPQTCQEYVMADNSHISLSVLRIQTISLRFGFAKCLIKSWEENELIPIRTLVFYRWNYLSE